MVSVPDPTRVTGHTGDVESKSETARMSMDDMRRSVERTQALAAAAGPPPAAAPARSLDETDPLKTAYWDTSDVIQHMESDHGHSFDRYPTRGEAEAAHAQAHTAGPGRPVAGFQSGHAAAFHGGGGGDQARDDHGRFASKAGYCATQDEYRAAVEAKRDFDKNVGGGVDRDKLPAGSFVFPDERAFPVHSPGDVADAVSSWGRYEGDQSFDSFKRRLIALARRKGDAFVSKLPDDWDVKPSKSWMYLGDSFEGKAALLSDAFDRWVDQMFPSAMVTGWVEATYPNFAVVGIAEEKGMAGPDHIEFWKLPYNIHDDDSVTLGEPKSLDIRGVATDRPGDVSDDITFLPRENVVAKALAYKSASRQRRHYALLAHQGVDITPTGLTPEMLAAAPSGSSTIPDPSDPDYRSGQSDLTTPGAAGPSATNTPVPAQGSYLDDAGNIAARDVPSWFQGTYYLDNQSNLVPSPVPGQGRYNEGLSNMPGTPVPGQGHYNDGANSNLPDPPALSAVGQSRDAGTLTLAGRSSGEAKSLLRQVKEQRYRIPGAPVAQPGTAPSEVDARLLAALPDIAEKAVALAVAVKEGRVMSAANGQTLASLHSELGKALAAAGAPVDAYQPTNETEGRDEEGVAITPQEAKAGITVDEVMAFQRHQAEMARLAGGGAQG